MTLDTFFDNFEQLAAAPNGVAKLRELILELAFKGMLLNKSANHEPAPDNSTARASIEKDEKNAGPASGWITCKLVDVAQVLMGNSPPGSSYNQQGEGMPLINGPVEFSFGHFGKTLRTKFTTSPTKCCEENDLLLCVRGSTTGRTNISAFRACIGRGVAAIRAKIYQEYINLFIYFKRQHIYDLGTGSTFPSIAQKDIESLVIPFPPVAEQKRIVAKVDELMRNCDELEQRLQRRREIRLHFNNATLAPFNNTVLLSAEELEQASVRLVDNFDVLYDSLDTVGKLRSTILQLGIQGKLVPQDSQDEPAAILLENLKSMKANSNVRKGRRKKEQTTKAEADKVPFTLPDGWQWSRFSRVAMIASNLVDPKDFLDYPHVAPDNIEKFTGKLLPYRSVREDSVVSSNHRFFSGQLVYSKIRPNLAKVVIVDFDGLCSADMYPINSLIYAPFLLKYMLSETFLRMAVKTDTRVAMPKINQEELNKLLVPVPPLSEQKRIVAKVNLLMSLCDELETKLRQAEVQGGKLINAVAQHVLRAIREAASINDLPKVANL